MVEILRVSDETTRAEIAAMLAVLRTEQKRAPACMVERYHERYNALLSDWLAAS
jgi:hypothetical protein